MRRKSWSALRWGVLVLATLGGTTARGESLQWKFKSGETLHYEMGEKTITSITAAGAEQSKTTVTQTIDSTWAVKGVDPQGTAELTQTIDRVRLKIETAVGSFGYDSSDAKPPEGPMAAVVPLFKVLIGTPFPFKMDPRGTLSDVRVPEKVVKALRELGEGAAGAGEMFSEEGLKTMLTQQSIALGKGDAAEETSWTQETRVPNPPLGSLVLTKTYRDQGRDPKREGVETIGVTVQVRLDNAPDAKITPKIKSQDAKGTISFDRANGHLLGLDLTQRMETAFSIQGSEVVQKVDRTMTTKLAPAQDAAKAK